MGLQAEFSQAGSLIGTEKGSRAGTERLSQTEDDRADQQLDDAAGIGGLPLLTCGLVHVHAAPDPHSKTGCESGKGYALGNTLGVFSHILPDFSERNGSLNKFGCKQPDSGDAEPCGCPAA